MALAPGFKQASEKYPVFHDLEDKVVLITGGAGGIGEETVYAFAAQGARVVFVDIDAAAGQKVAEKSAASGAKHPATFIKWDLAEVQTLDQLVDAVLAKTGRIDVLVNNAANDKRVDFQGAAFYEEYMRSRALNGDSPVFLTRAVLQKSMAPNQYGTIVNISSVHAVMASDPNMLPYGMSKSGLNHFSEWVAHTYGALGIRSNAIEPGWIATKKQMESVMTPEAVQDTLNKQTVKRIGHNRDIASAVLFCASSTSAFMNGQVMRVDGGAIGNYNPVEVQPDSVRDPVTRQSLGLKP